MSKKKEVVEEERISSFSINETTGAIKIDLPKYKEDEFITYPSLLVMAIAQKIANDTEWADALVSDAEQQAMSGPKLVS